MNRILKRILALLAFAACLPTLAQPVRIVSGVPAGGGVDAVARLLAEHMARQSGRPHIVETRTGAGGIIAVQSMLNAPADGTVLLLAPDSNIVIYPHSVASAGFALTDLAPISTVVHYDLALSVPGGSGIRSLTGLKAAALADSKGATFASPAAGSLQHFFGLSVAKAIGINLLHVPYRGVAPAITDTIGGVVLALVTPVGPVLQHAQAGSLRIIATSGASRGSKTQDVPTFKELGYPQLVRRGWFGLFAPAKTPPETLQRVSKYLQVALNDPEFRAKLAALDMEPSWVSQQEFRREVEKESSAWSHIVRDSGFRADR